MHFSCQLDALEFTIPITLWHNYVNFHFIALPTRTQVYKYRRKRHGNGKVARMVGRHQLLWLASCLAAVQHDMLAAFLKPNCIHLGLLPATRFLSEAVNLVSQARLSRRESLARETTVNFPRRRYRAGDTVHLFWTSNKQSFRKKNAWLLGSKCVGEILWLDIFIV